MKYSEMNANELGILYSELKLQYGEICRRGLSLDLTRGKPSAEQLKLSEGMLNCLATSEDCIGEGGVDYRNYGLPEGIPEARELFSELLGIKSENILVGGNSSLALMYDTVVHAMLFGFSGGEPWCRQKVKFICPSPGYDRHFAICERLGIEMTAVDMTGTGPDIDAVERLVSEDASVKGIWCCPKYSNPEGITYSDETVERLARMPTAAEDFRIFWDNAYAVHDLYPDRHDTLADIFELSERHGNADRAICFASTSKITFAGAGVAVLAASKRNLENLLPTIRTRTIGFDKLNQLRHVRFFENAENIRRHMMRHAEIIRPKFEIVENTLKSELGGLGIAEWTEPLGGYFVSLNTLDGCAERVWTLANDAGVALTPAGATFPYGKDPHDRNLRIAPTYPEENELRLAMEVLCLSVKLASVEKYMNS